MTSIGNYAFSGTGLTSVTIPSSVTSIGSGAFLKCDDLSEVTFLATTSQVDDGVFRECKNLKRVTFASGVPCIADRMFSGCESLTSVTIPSSVTSIGSSAFYSCTGLTSMTIPSSVTSIGNLAFSDCTGLTSVTIPSSVTSIGSGAFGKCGKLTQVTFNASISAEEKRAAFQDTPWYQNLDETVFKSENGVLVSYNGPGGDVVIPSGITAIDDGTFLVWGSPDTPINSIVIPSSVTRIGNGAFYNRDDLKSVTIMPGVKTIGHSAFFGCPLTEVVIPEGVTTIESGAFVMGGRMLKSVYIPASVTSIAKGAFPWDRIGAIYYGGSKADWYAIKWDTYDGKPGNVADGGSDANMHYNSPMPAPAEPTVGNFTDVKPGDYYADPVLWAVEKGITTGTSATKFSPNTTCTQAQILTFLWRAKGEPAPTGTVSGTEYYAAAAQWAKEQGLTDDFSANADCTRAMVVTYLWKLAGSPETGASGFSDVPADADYAQAVAWAVSKGITNGTSDTTFTPGKTCTRGQIVTFLYRAFAN